MHNNSFVVYNASAGSGKTFTLVKAYLKALFSSYKKEKFKHILAITFTNKAVAEMKERILENIEHFANVKVLANPSDMFCAIAEELELDHKVLHEKAIKIHDALLNNYAAFDVVTIDTFTHRIIRTFAYDLKLPQNFEVALDTEDVLQEAIHNVLSRVGEDEKLSKLLIDFALQKADDDKSWDVSIDLYKTAKLLLNENEIKHLSLIKDKKLEDFDALKKTLSEKIKLAKSSIVSIAKNLLENFNDKGVTANEIKYIYGYFLKLSKEDFNVKYGAAWQNKLTEGSTLYPKRVDGALASAIDEMQPKIASDFETTKTLFFEISFLKNFQKNIVPLSVLNVINQELQKIKEEQNILLISEFNQIISNEIKDQPAPFIYERIGERYQNYFIDEFQDTSLMQWQNLIPLTENALVTETEVTEQNSLMLVGDAKQAIYRWRGGKPEQFIDLYEDKNPFFIEKKVANLETNYRSYSEIIDFNNNFFTFLSNTFANNTHQSLYEIGNKQKQNNKKGGYVKLSFIDENKEEDSTILYQEHVLETINNVLAKGFKKTDICIVTRKKKDGIAIADYLVSQNIDIISSETLLLSKSPEIKFIISFLNYLLQPHNKTYKIEILYYLFNNINNNGSEHQFYYSLLALPPEAFFKELSISHQIHFDYSNFQILPFYELVEQIIRSFNLVKDSDAYIQYFLDEVLNFSRKKLTGIQGFIDHWEIKKDKLSIVAPDGLDAVNIMTVHKSKGLEFPVIILPFAELNIYKEIDPKIWFPIDKDTYNGFSEAYLNFNKDVIMYGDAGADMFTHRQSQLELDNINLLYVALTRPKEQLYIISKKSLDKNKQEKEGTYSGFFIKYLKSLGLWNEDQDYYEFGNNTKQSKTTEIITSGELPFISSSRVDHNLSIITKSGYLWDTQQQEAIEKGNLIHLILSKIKYQEDLEIAFQELISEGVLNKQQEKQLKPIIENVVLQSELSSYYDEKYSVYNEREILSEDGQILIPDRIVINNKTATIIDYKTGVFNTKHEEQVNNYAQALIEMNYTIKKKLLVYIDNEILIKEVL